MINSFLNTVIHPKTVSTQVTPHLAYPHSTGEVPAVLLRPLFLTSLPDGGSPSLRLENGKKSYGAVDPIQLFLLLLEIMLLSWDPSFQLSVESCDGEPKNTNLLVPGVGLSGVLWSTIIQENGFHVVSPRKQRAHPCSQCGPEMSKAMQVRCENKIRT